MEDRSYTRLLPTIKKTMREHAEKSFAIQTWLKSIGCVIKYECTLDNFMRRTAVDIRVRHTNDYIECGPGFDDPEGKMFYVITRQEFKIEFTSDQLVSTIEKLNAFHNNKLKIKPLENVILANFFSWERVIKADWYQVERGNPKLGMILKFDIYHTQKEQKRKISTT